MFIVIQQKSNVVCVYFVDINRPPLMKRETIIIWIEYCSHCGYCSSNISDQQGVKEKRYHVYSIIFIINTLGIAQQNH